MEIFMARGMKKRAKKKDGKMMPKAKAKKGMKKRAKMK